VSDTFSRILGLIEANEVRISEHGYDQLADDKIGVREILDGVTTARVVEDYPTYPKGPLVLVLQFDASGRPIHVL
jgi:hypothetical protein